MSTSPTGGFKCGHISGLVEEEANVASAAVQAKGSISSSGVDALGLTYGRHSLPSGDGASKHDILKT